MSICCFDENGPDVFRESQHHAAKEYHCDECHRLIKKGDLYTRTWGVWEGDPDTIITCEPCTDLRDSLSLVWCPVYYDLLQCFAEYRDYMGLEPKPLGWRP